MKQVERALRESLFWTTAVKKTKQKKKSEFGVILSLQDPGGKDRVGQGEGDHH